MGANSSCTVLSTIKQLDSSSWLIGSKNRHILRRTQTPSQDYLWKNHSNTIFYTLTLTPPKTDIPQNPHPSNSNVRLLHYVQNRCAVICFHDEIILKVRHAEGGTRREHLTLGFLADEKLSFDVPEVLLHHEEDRKTFLFETYVPGKTLNEAWWDMSMKEKEHITTRVAEICQEVQMLRSGTMTAADHYWLDPYQQPRNFKMLHLKAHCEKLGMDCSSFVLSHNDLGPRNIILNGDRIIVLDWELAGYMPLAWVRTKFAVSSALRVERLVDGVVQADDEYRLRVERKLGEKGFSEVTRAWREMEEVRIEKWRRDRPWFPPRD